LKIIFTKTAQTCCLLQQRVTGIFDNSLSNGWPDGSAPLLVAHQLWCGDSGAWRDVKRKMIFYINYHSGPVPVKTENYYLFLKVRD
jgi:hypothetical protein